MWTNSISFSELLKIRDYLTAIINSTKNFLHVEISNKEIKNALKRLKQIDRELVDRLMGDHLND